ncbi:MAG: hypothetical protein AB7F40_09775 [Victivallaceae bacterium]|nr:hypothetical protein [Victivallaceae bacterium]
MEPPKARIRLKAIMAREAPYAVVFRRGPSKIFATVGWNLEDDTFAMGQWVRGIIDVYRSDLSPDGRFLLYDIATYHGPQGRHTHECHTGISYAPYLHALDLYFHSYIDVGGGCFIDNTQVFFYGAGGVRYPEDRHLTNLESVLPYDCDRYLNCYAGWSRASERVWRKPLPGGRILEKHLIPGDSIEGEKMHRLLDAFGRTEVDGTDWDWAEYDSARDRIVFAQGGKLSALPLSAVMNEPVLLRDFTSMEYAPQPAPYAGPRPEDSRKARR